MVRGVVGLALLATLGSASPPASAADTCPNAAVRTQQFTTDLLADCRAWEMVSPVDKNGGQISPAGTLFGGGVLQAAAQGGVVTYSSAGSFGGGAGAPPASQYIASRNSSGWPAQNITVPIFAGSFGVDPNGAPYQLFSGDLARGLLLNGRHCRGDATGCPVANPTLPGTDAPAGFQNYYLRESAAGAFEALLGPADVTGLDPADFSVTFAGASPDLRHAVLSSCARLTADATDGCGAARQNLYLHSGGNLTLINATPGATLAAQSSAVSTNGTRVYWRDLTSGNLFLHEGGTSSQVDTDAGGGGTFETASTDGSVAFYTKAGALWRYEAGDSTNLTSGVLGVLGASESASHLYYRTAAGVFLRQGATTTQVADAADASNHPPSTGTARVSADGTKLLFVSTTALRTYDNNRYDNRDARTGVLRSQVYLYDATAARLTCVSCNPTGARPIGPSSIPGSNLNGEGPEATNSYKSRVLSIGGGRVFFDSGDDLVVTDTNNEPDVYQWEAQGTGSCATAAGCITLISSGRSSDGASFVDASADGSDAFFLTDGSLVSADPGSVDLYVARIGGGFLDPQQPIPCNGDACQVLPPEAVDPTLTTLLAGLGNPPVRYSRYGAGRQSCPKGKKLKTVTRGDGKKVRKCVVKKRRKGGRGR